MASARATPSESVGATGGSKVDVAVRFKADAQVVHRLAFSTGDLKHHRVGDAFSNDPAQVALAEANDLYGQIGFVGHEHDMKRIFEFAAAIVSILIVTGSLGAGVESRALDRRPAVFRRLSPWLDN